MYEPNTALTQRLRAGNVEPVDEETEIAMYELVVDTLAQEGFDAYEISNFARAGEECRHNLAYWNQDPWLALGPSASAHVGGHRWKNVPHLTRWMQSIHASGGFPVVTDHEPPDERRALAERLMTGVRLTKGFDASDALVEASRLGVRTRLDDALASLIHDGTMTADGDVWRLTREGIILADEAGARFIEAVMD
jgi:oxygen-independent coproporphyrinogen-3 oxidase